MKKMWRKLNPLNWDVLFALCVVGFITGSLIYFLAPDGGPRRAHAITGPVYCDKTAQFSGAGTGNTLLISGAATGSSQTFICNFTASGGATGAATLSYGQGATCGTNNTVLALGNMVAGSLFRYGGGPWSGMLAPGPVGGAVTNVCVNNAVASDAAWVVSYTQQ